LFFSTFKLLFKCLSYRVMFFFILKLIDVLVRNNFSIVKLFRTFFRCLLAVFRLSCLDLFVLYIFAFFIEVLFFDSVAVIMLIVVCAIPSFLHLYSIEYMKPDPHQGRFHELSVTFHIFYASFSLPLQFYFISWLEKYTFIILINRLLWQQDTLCLFYYFLPLLEKKILAENNGRING